MRCIGVIMWVSITSQIHCILGVLCNHINKGFFLQSWQDYMLCDVLPLWAVGFWEAHDRPWQTPQTCHVFADLKLCDTKQMPRPPAHRNKRIRPLIWIDRRNCLHQRTAWLLIHLHEVRTWASFVWLLLLLNGSWDSSAAVAAAFSAAMRICTEQRRKRGKPL